MTTQLEKMRFEMTAAAIMGNMHGALTAMEAGELEEARTKLACAFLQSCTLGEDLDVIAIQNRAATALAHEVAYMRVAAAAVDKMMGGTNGD